MRQRVLYLFLTARPLMLCVRIGDKSSFLKLSKAFDAALGNFKHIVRAGNLINTFRFRISNMLLVFLRTFLVSVG